MVITLIVVITIVVFIVVDLILRVLLKKVRDNRVRKEREKALDIGLKLDVSEEANTLKRVEVENPRARILAVDDEQIILDSFRKILVLEGFSIDTVEKGSEVLGLIRKNDYDFVFTDLKMPEMNGVEVTKAVKHLRPDIDVIVITGYASIETAVETVKFGAMDYVEKPFTEDELLAFINAALIKRQAKIEKQMRHKIRLIKSELRTAKSNFELNVPKGVFVSEQHAWVRLEMNGMIRIGLDDLMRKIFQKIDHIDLPELHTKVERGQTLFSISQDSYRFEIPSPFSGTISAVNEEQAEHPEWLKSKPFELSWMCAIEPSNLAGELPRLKIGNDLIEWYEQKIDRYNSLLDNYKAINAQSEQDQETQNAQNGDAEYFKLLAEFSKPLVKVD